MRPKKRVLLVDADEARLSLRRMVLRLNGYRVESAGTAAEALGMLPEWKWRSDSSLHDQVDLVVVELALPDMEIGRFVLEVRTLHAGLPCLLLSDEVQGVRDGCVSADGRRDQPGAARESETDVRACALAEAAGSRAGGGCGRMGGPPEFLSS